MKAASRTELIGALRKGEKEIRIEGEYADSFLNRYRDALFSRMIPDDVQIAPLPKLGTGTVLQNYGLKKYEKGKYCIIEYGLKPERRRWKIKL